VSRGLGRVEKKILEFLNDEQITKERRTKFRHVPDIVVYVYDIEYPHYGRNGDPPDDTEFLDLIKRDGARYQSVCRALRQLEQKGLIKSKSSELWNYKLIYPV